MGRPLRHKGTGLRLGRPAPIHLEKRVARALPRGYAFFFGSSLCYSALFKAGRHDQILKLLTMDPRLICTYLGWVAKVLAARGQIDEAIAYLLENAGGTTSETFIARFAE